MFWNIAFFVSTNVLLTFRSLVRQLRILTFVITVNTDSMWMYYRDVSLYALGASLLPSLSTAGLYDSFGAWLLNLLLIFAVFGTGLGVLGFWYFQKQQYYMYFNLGFSKTHLILRTWGINLAIAILLALFIQIF